MKKTLSSQNFLQGCSITGGVLFVVLLFLVVMVLRWPNASQTITLTDLTKAHKIYVRAPVFPFRTGDMFVLYEGVINTNAKLELAFNGGRDKAIIPLQLGEVSGVYGGAEDWGDDLSVRFVPCENVHGTLKITAICGRRFTKKEWEWYSKLHKEEFDARMREPGQKTKGE